MQKAAIALGAGLVLTLGLLVQSSLTASGLKAEIASLEEAKKAADQEKRDLAVRLEAEQRQRASLEGRLSAVQEHQTTLEDKLRPFEERKAAIRPVNAEVVVPPGTTQTMSFTPTMVPGTLSGTWRSSGTAYGALTNSITELRVLAPGDRLLKSFQNASSGQFVVKIDSPGTYTFAMDNKGLLVRNARKVFIEGEFRPD